MEGNGKVIINGEYHIGLMCLTVRMIKDPIALALFVYCRAVAGDSSLLGYEAIAKHFGITERQVKIAQTYLETIGVWESESETD